MLSHTTPAMSAAADLRAGTPAFVQAPTFVFNAAAQGPTRSELLRRQIVAAQEARRSPR